MKDSKDGKIVDKTKNNPFLEISYPIMEKGDWRKSLINIINETNEEEVNTIYSKTFISFLLDLSIHESELAYSINSRIFSYKIGEDNILGYEMEYYNLKNLEKNRINDKEARKYIDAEKINLENLAEQIKPIPFMSVNYPTKEKNGWHLTRIKNFGPDCPERIFSKKYGNYLADVIIAKNKSGYYVKGRIFDPSEGNDIKYDSPKKYFCGNDASEKAEKYAKIERLKVDDFVEGVLLNL